MAYLRYLDDQGRLQTCVLDTEHFVIGRAETCQLSFDSDMISREHLRIDLEDGGRYRVRDLSSRNRTYVNGELVNETLLTPGSIIRFGDRLVEFVDETVGPERVDLEFLTPDRTEPPGCEWVRIKAPLSLTADQIEQLAILLQDQSLTARVEDVADTALGQLILALGAERGFIALRGEKKTDLRILTHRALKRPAAGSLTPVSQTFVLAPILQGAAGRYPSAASKMDTRLGYAATAVTAPLTHRGDIVGVLYVDRPSARKPFASAALQFCAAAGAQIGSLLVGTVQRQAQFAGREGATWMATIRRLQASLTTPVESSEGFDAAVKRFPGRLQCGDFGMITHIDEQRCAALVLDGGGQGITGIIQAAAIQMAVQSTLAAADDALADPGPMFNAINRRIHESPARQLLPSLFVGLDMAAGKLTYINAGGMPPLLMVAPGRLVTLDQVSLVLGVDGDYAYQATTVELPERFRVVCHTDGLTEAASAAGQAFGDQRLHEALLDHKAFGTAAQVVETVERAWSSHLAGAQSADDALVLALARG